MINLRPRSPFEYVQLLWRRKLLIGVIALVVLLAALIVIKKMPNVYESRALIVITGLPNDEARQGIASAITLTTQRLTSRSTLEPLIQRHNLYPGLRQDQQVALLQKALKLETKLRNYFPETPEAVTLVFSYTEPAIAQRVLADLVALFNQMNETVSQQVAEEARQVGSKISNVENQLRQMSARRVTRGSTLDLGAIRAERQAAGASLESLTDKQYSLQRQIADQRKQIAEQQELFKSATPANQSGAQGVLLVRRAELEAQLKDYATQYTEKNPKVTQTRNQLSEINHQLSQLASTGTTSLASTPEGRELRSLERELARMETELEVTQREMGRRKEKLVALPNVMLSAPSSPLPSDTEAVGGLPTAQLGVLQNRYVTLLDRQDRMERSLAAPVERGLTPFRLVDPPNFPQLPIGPNRQKFKLMALGFAFLVGLIVAGALEGARLRLIQDRRDAEYFLGAPVVALIPETLTPVEQGHQRRLLLTRKLGFLLLAVVMVPVLALLLYTASKFFI